MRRFLAALAAVCLLAFPAQAKQIKDCFDNDGRHFCKSTFGNPFFNVPKVDKVRKIEKRYPIIEGTRKRDGSPGTIAEKKPVPIKTAAVNHGLGGQFLAPLGALAKKVAAKGYRVSIDGNPNGKTVVIAHSISCLALAQSNAQKKVFIDCPIWWRFPPKQAGRCVNFYTVGHPQIYGCINVPIRATHLSAPYVAERQILALL